jgi:hypothetical protein
VLPVTKMFPVQTESWKKFESCLWFFHFFVIIYRWMLKQNRITSVLFCTWYSHENNLSKNYWQRHSPFGHLFIFHFSLIFLNIFCKFHKI